MALHGSVGPANTTAAGIAELAGVTRATFYRHFPDIDSLFSACHSAWAAGMTFPDLSEWKRIADPAARLRHGLRDLYRFYQDGEPMLEVVIRDRAAVPTFLVEARLAREAAQAKCLRDPFPASVRRRHRFGAAIAHGIAFSTYQSLRAQGLDSKAAADLVADMITGLGSAPAVRGATTPPEVPRRTTLR